MWFLNKRKQGIKDLVTQNDIQTLINNPAWQLLTQQWEQDADDLQVLLMQAPKEEVRNEKGQLVMTSFENVRGQLDNMLAVLSSVSVLDEAIEADVTLSNMNKQNKPGGQEDGQQ